MTQSLILTFSLTACNTNTRDTSSISVQWQDSVATGLIVPRQLLASFPEDSLGDLLLIHLLNDSVQLPVFGEYSFDRDAVVFKPLIPFTPNLSYEVRFSGKSLAIVKIPAGQHKDPPKVTAVYPSQDTLPENLLKMYIQFSRPMKESDPLQYISLLRDGKDTLDGVFLDLHPALWNKEGTFLTLWLDPGRIKRDLQPNKNLGTPLRKGESYEMVINLQWQTKDGATLLEPFSKKFVVTSRDEEYPKPSAWSTQAPASETSQPLIIQFPEPLDYVLLKEAIFVEDPGGSVVAGKSEMEREEMVLRFIPDHPWQPGVYSVVCEARLEDVAGNNLNRLFDQEITGQKTTPQEESYWIDFTID